MRTACSPLPRLPRALTISVISRCLLALPRPIWPLSSHCYAASATSAATPIIASGEQSDDRLFLLLAGEVSVILPLSDGTRQRVATLSAGMTFGEMAVLGHTPRSATVYADTDAECWVLQHTPSTWSPPIIRV